MGEPTGVGGLVADACAVEAVQGTDVLQDILWSAEQVDWARVGRDVNERNVVSLVRYLVCRPCGALPILMSSSSEGRSNRVDVEHLLVPYSAGDNMLEYDDGNLFHLVET